MDKLTVSQDRNARNLADLQKGVIAKAEKVFGNPEKARRWLNEPNPALGWKIPIQFISSQENIDTVDAILTRIEYGVLS